MTLAACLGLAHGSRCRATSPTMPKRPAAPAVDAAIHRALEYLESSQRPDGAWESGGFGPATSVTSLAVMAFLAAGHVPGEPGPYRESIERGIRYVLDHQHPNGVIASNVEQRPDVLPRHQHADARRGRRHDRRRRARRAGPRRAGAGGQGDRRGAEPQEGQDHAGGWRYQPSSDDSDISVTGWQLMALRAARSAGCEVPSENIDRAIATSSGAPSRTAADSPTSPAAAPNNPRTGTGILALEICGEHLTPEAVAGAEYLLKHPPQVVRAIPSSTRSITARSACSRSATSISSPIIPSSSSILLAHQGKDGSWLSDDSHDRTGGRNYCTAMAVLALTVEYRYLPIYQR